MAITAGQVKELREKTGVGMMECKKALSESDGDMEKAVLWLRERGMSRAQKKAGRVTAEGLVGVLLNDAQTAGVVLEVNCETDFVSKNDDFKKFVADASKLALDNKVTSVQELGDIAMASGKTVADTLTSLIATIGENLQLRRVACLQADDGIVAGYTHMGGGIGTLVALKGTKNTELAKDLAMHIAAAAPRYLTNDQVDATELEQEKELAKKKLLEEGKPENMIDKIMAGQMSKFYKEVCLIEQAFVKDPKTSIKQLLASDGGASITGFQRFQLGEGIEKKSDNFADEVKSLTK